MTEQTTTQTFDITPRDDRHEPFIVEAESYELAARAAARHMYQRSPRHNVTISRTTGDRGKSGFFRAYEPAQQGTARNAIGEPFHVS